METDPAPRPIAVSINTAALMLDVGRSTIYNQMSAGNLKWIWLGSDRRIPLAEIERAARDGLPKLTRKTK